MYKNYTDNSTDLQNDLPANCPGLMAEDGIAVDSELKVNGEHVCVIPYGVASFAPYWLLDKIYIWLRTIVWYICVFQCNKLIGNLFIIFV